MEEEETSLKLCISQQVCQQADSSEGGLAKAAPFFLLLYTCNIFSCGAPLVGPAIFSWGRDLDV